MTPSMYFDVTCSGSKAKATPIVVGELVQILHIGIARHPGVFAIAFPRLREGDTEADPGKIVRVFAESAEMLDGMADLVEASQALEPLIAIGRIKSVRLENVKNWISYQRYRIPARPKSKGRPQGLIQADMQRRVRRIADSECMAYIMLDSSKGQNFSIRITLERSSEPDFSAVSDGYGLSRSSQKVWLPEI